MTPTSRLKNKNKSPRYNISVVVVVVVVSVCRVYRLQTSVLSPVFVFMVRLDPVHTAALTRNIGSVYSRFYLMLTAAS